MTKRKQLVSSESTKLSSASGEEETDYFGWLSVDLAVKILSKLPLKTIAKCRCVSKLWSSIIRRPNYNQLFSIKSPPTPRLVLTGIFNEELYFYSSSQPQNMDKNSSLVVTHHPKHSGIYEHRVCSSVGGLVCSQHIGKDYTLAVITNPITGESVTTPELKILHIYWSMVKMYFGYDPVEKQVKVLCIYQTLPPGGGSFSEYRVLTLGTGIGSLVWRKIQCCIPCNGMRNEDGICINGVLYYRTKESMIVCFDVKTEKFSFINFDQGFELGKMWGGEYLNLIDYKGKLGAIKIKEDMDNHFFLFCGF